VKTIAYLHGFISSPLSKKAVMLGEYLRANAPEVTYLVPELHHRPAQAVAQIRAACANAKPGDLTLVGSSLGGFYATAVAEALDCKAALLNPAVHPHTHFAKFLGPQRNLYTGESFELTQAHIDELAALDVPEISNLERYRLFVETGDEVLDYREATRYYTGAFQTVIEGGDHALSSFPEHLPELVAWAMS
jgi:predicted esterase YcpF (UPF0227 family)